MSRTVSYEEARQLFGFDVPQPGYVPAGLHAPEQVWVTLRDSQAFRADLLYVDREHPAEALSLLLSFDVGAPPVGFELGAVQVSGVMVDVDEDASEGGAVYADWPNNGLFFHLQLHAGSAPIDRPALRAEAVEIIRSMVEDR